MVQDSGRRKNRRLLTAVLTVGVVVAVAGVGTSASGRPVTNAVVVDGSGAVTIGASGGTPVATPAISAPPDVVVGEADGYVDLPVSLDSPGESTVTVNYATANGTAAGGDVCSYVFVPATGTLTFAPGETTKVVRVDLNNCGLANPGTFTLNLSSPNNATITRATTQIMIVSGSLLAVTQAVSVPTVTLAGVPYNALFRASPLATFALVGGPSWLAISSTGAVTGTPPDGTTSFSFSVSATGSTTAGPYTVNVNSGAPVSGTVVATDGTAIAGAPVEACQANTGWECQNTVTAADGTFSLQAAIGASIVLTAYPPSGSQLVKASTGALDVPAAGLSGISITETGIGPLPGGLEINGHSTSPVVNWAVPSTATLSGCPDGLATVSVVGENTATGQWDYNVIPLTETPAGSGNYVGTIPPLYPVHGPVYYDDSVTCPPESPLLPNSGPATGGTTVAITGSGFTGATGVSFGGTAAESFTVEADDLIEAIAPQGMGTVSVTVAAGGSTQVIDDYTYESIKSISPQQGPPEGGSVVDIVGTGLGSATDVLFGGVGADFTQISDTEIQAVSPPGSGTQDITVTTAFGGTTPTTPADEFTYGTSGSSAKPTIAMLEKRTALAVPNARSAGAELLGSTPHSLRLQSAAPLTAKRPTWYLVARETLQNYNRFERSLDKKPIKAALAEAIASVHPTCETQHAFLEAYTSFAAQASVGALLKIGVAASTIVKTIAAYADAPFSAGLLKQVTTTVTQQASSNLIDRLSKAAVNAYFGACPKQKPTANGYVDPSGTVLDSNGNPIDGATVTILRSDSAAGPFAPVPATSPDITPGVNPETTGSDGVFQWDVLSGFYEVQASNSGCSDPSQPGSPTATIGPYPVPPPQVGLTITLDCPNEAPPPVPTLTSLSVGTGPPAGGTDVTILGTGFTPSSTVTFGNTSAAVTYLSPEALAVVSPPGAGLVDVVAQNSGTSSATSDADQFFYGAQATVSGLSVNHGSALGGTSVTVTGTGFTGATDVGFGGLPASAFTVVSDTEIQATAPPGPAGAVDVQVVNPAGGSDPTAADQFTYDHAAQTITFTSTPPAKPVVGGTYDVSGTASSGLPVTFSIDPSSSSGCSIQGSTAKLSAPAGSCVIDARQPGDGTYSAASEVQQVVIVSAATQTVPAGSPPAQTLTPVSTPAVPRCSLKTTGSQVALKGSKAGVLILKLTCDQGVLFRIGGKITITLRKGKKTKTSIASLSGPQGHTSANTQTTVKVKLSATDLKDLKKLASESVVFGLTASNTNGSTTAKASIKHLQPKPAAGRPA